MSYVGGGGGGLASSIGAAQAVNIGGGGGGGGGLAQMNAYGIEFERSQKRTNITIEQVENGYYVTINNKNYICVDPQEIADRLVSQMVAKKMEK